MILQIDRWCGSDDSEDKDQERFDQRQVLENGKTMARGRYLWMSNRAILIADIVDWSFTRRGFSPIIGYPCSIGASDNIHILTLYFQRGKVSKSIYVLYVYMNFYSDVNK